MVEFPKMPEQDDGLDGFDEALRSALRPLPAPDGFADRVLARSQELPAPAPLAFRKRHGFSPLLRWSIAAALLLVVAAGTFTAHQRQRRVAGERARDQVLLALRITSLTIHAVREQVDRENHNNSQQ